MEQKTKMTEKQFFQALVSSVCCILLCMACFVGTTWAWFVASVENNENEVTVASWALETLVTDQATAAAVQPVEGVYTLGQGSYTIDLRFTSNAKGDAFTSADTVYVLMQQTQNGVTEKYCAQLTLPDGNTFRIDTYAVYADTQVRFCFTRMDPGVTRMDSTTFAVQSQPEATEITAATETTVPAASTDATE